MTTIGNTHKRLRWLLLGTIFFTTMVFYASAVSEHCVNPDSPWGRRKQQLEEQYQIVICFDEVGPDIRFYQGEFQPVPAATRLVALEGLAVDLKQYSPQFVARHVNRIYIFQSLQLRGQNYGGTFEPFHKWIYIHHGWLGDDEQKPVGGGFHSEFSSILISRHPLLFSQSAWRLLNGEDFAYERRFSSWKNLRDGPTNLVGEETIYAQGFLNEYSLNTAEDDMNAFAQYLIAKPALLAEIAADYPTIQAKAGILSCAYAAVGYPQPAELSQEAGCDR